MTRLRTTVIPSVSSGCALPSAAPWRRDDPGAEIREAGFILRLEVPGSQRGPGPARQARVALCGILARWQVVGDAADNAVLLVSELAANALKFSQRDFTAAAWRLPGLLVIEVSDESPRLPVRRHAGLGAESGRGLNIVNGICREWGFYHPRPGWKTVFGVLDAPAGKAVFVRDSAGIRIVDEWPGPVGEQFPFCRVELAVSGIDGPGHV